MSDRIVPFGRLFVAQRMTITLTKAEIETALPRVAAGLKKYLWLQAQRDRCDLRSNSEYRRRFNGFYRVRRGRDWQDTFFDLLERKKGQTISTPTSLQ